MADDKITRSKGNTVEFTLTIPWASVTKAKEEALGELSQSLEIKGFRKGKAPKALVEKHINPEKLTQELLNHLLPRAYAQAVNDSGVKPIILPTIKIVETGNNQDWVFTATTCEAPTVKLDSYQQKLKNHLSSSGIWVPGSSKTAPQKKDEKIQTVIDWLVKNIEVELSGILISEEINHLLTKLLDQLQKLGLTVEQYLSSKKMTQDQLKEEYKTIAIDNLKLEFILAAVASQEKTFPTKDEVDKLIGSAEPSLSENLKDKANLKTIHAALTRSKTLDFLAQLA